MTCDSCKNKTENSRNKCTQCEKTHGLDSIREEMASLTSMASQIQKRLDSLQDSVKSVDRGKLRPVKKSSTSFKRGIKHVNKVKVVAPCKVINMNTVKKLESICTVTKVRGEKQNSLDKKEVVKSNVSDGTPHASPKVVTPHTSIKVVTLYPSNEVVTPHTSVNVVTPHHLNEVVTPHTSLDVFRPYPSNENVTPHTSPEDFTHSESVNQSKCGILFKKRKYLDQHNRKGCKKCKTIQQSTLLGSDLALEYKESVIGIEQKAKDIDMFLLEPKVEIIESDQDVTTDMMDKSEATPPATAAPPPPLRQTAPLLRDPVVPGGWSWVRKGGKSVCYSSPKGLIFSSCLAALRFMIRNLKNGQVTRGEVEVMRRNLWQDGWREEAFLPKGWLLLQQGRKGFHLLSETLKLFESLRTATEFLRRENKMTEDLIQNIYIQLGLKKQKGSKVNLTVEPPILMTSASPLPISAPAASTHSTPGVFLTALARPTAPVRLPTPASSTNAAPVRPTYTVRPTAYVRPTAHIRPTAPAPPPAPPCLPTPAHSTYTTHPTYLTSPTAPPTFLLLDVPQPFLAILLQLAVLPLSVVLLLLVPRLLLSPFYLHPLLLQLLWAWL